MAAMMPHHDEPFPDDASLAASLEDFEAQEKRSPMFGIPSQVSYSDSLSIKEELLGSAKERSRG